MNLRNRSRAEESWLAEQGGWDGEKRQRGGGMERLRQKKKGGGGRRRVSLIRQRMCVKQRSPLSYL